MNTSQDRAVKQFTTRVPALATEVGLPRLNGWWAERIYKMRSKLAHGQGILGSVDKHAQHTKRREFNDALIDLDELLRRVLRRALIDADFREQLENADQNWPISP